MKYGAFLKPSPEDIFIDFRERETGRKREREREGERERERN